jgi:hypothetical protein
MKVKTSELTGAALDWATSIVFNPAPEWGKWNPSINWAQGGPIIEREEISLDYAQADDWAARSPTSIRSARPSRARPSPRGGWRLTAVDRWAYGPTPLIAAMRCYVASKLGDEVEIPEEFSK